MCLFKAIGAQGPTQVTDLTCAPPRVHSLKVISFSQGWWLCSHSFKDAQKDNDRPGRTHRGSYSWVGQQKVVCIRRCLEPSIRFCKFILDCHIHIGATCPQKFDWDPSQDKSKMSTDYVCIVHQQRTVSKGHLSVWCEVLQFAVLAF